MNVITALTAAAATLSHRPAESESGFLIFPAVIVIIVAIAIAVYLVDGCYWEWPVPTISAAFIVIVIGAGTTAFIVTDTARSGEEIAAWDTEAAAWAEDVYGVEAGADELVFSYDCPTDNKCYNGKVLIDDHLTEVTLVTVSDRTLLLVGDGESGKELRQVKR